MGSGKSSILKLLILQNIKRRQGFMVVDPHGELARDILSVIPRSMHDDTIYVNPASLYRFGRVIRVNPLQVDSADERYLVVMTFVNALHNLYRESWGPRLETILRNAANALVETRYNTLGNLSAMITDPDRRRSILEGVSSRTVRHFWNDIYEKQYSRDAGSSAYNKIDKILATPAVAAMFDAAASSIDIPEIMREGRMLIIDLGAGASDDVAAFLGTILLNMVYVEAKKRLDILGEAARRQPFYVYVDEAHLFSNNTMSEMLRSLRKFGVRMTIATQTANAYSKAFADELTGICQCIVCGHCDYNTASLVSPAMSIGVRDLERLPNHMFAYYSAEDGRPVSGIIRTRPVPAEGQDRWDWDVVARHSLEKWGEEAAASRYSMGGHALMNPLEAAVLCAMRGGRLTKDEIISRVSHLAGGREATSALTDTLEQGLGFVERDGPSYVVSKGALKSYFSRAGFGRRAGGDLHLGTIFRIMEHNMRAGRYCTPDLGERGGDRPDLLIMEPASRMHRGRRVCDPYVWNERNVVALEVETAPRKHLPQISKNYTKNHSAGRMVWFVAFSEGDRNAIRAQLDGGDASTYHIDVVDRSFAEGMGEVPPAPFLLTEYVPLY